MGNREAMPLLPPEPTGRVGIVAIGRNEGARLPRCLDSLPRTDAAVVYVDSASSDGSVDEARRRGIDVVVLDAGIPLTAARARNAGWRRLLATCPDVEFVQFVDGDCALAPGWLDHAVAELSRDHGAALVAGRRREIDRMATVYNRLCDMEWDGPPGEVESCGGDVLARVEALLAVDGYDPRLICGEEPEMCARLRARGWRVRRIGRDMTFHDAAMTRFRQWWRRAERSGHGFAELHRRDRSLYGRELRSALFWGGALPVAALAALPAWPVLGLGLLAAYPVLWTRILLRHPGVEDGDGDAALRATFCVAGKFPEFTGVARFAWGRVRRRATGLIEYK